MCARQRTPVVATAVEPILVNENPQDGCLEELRGTVAELDRQGFLWRHSWADFREGKRPPQNVARDPGTQYWASSVTDTHYRRISMLAGRPASRRAHLRSFWPQRRRRVVPRANSSRVHCSSPFAPRALVGALGTPFASH